MKRISITLQGPMPYPEIERLQMKASRWLREGGVLITPADVIIQDFSDTSDSESLPENTCPASASWALEVRV